MSEDSMALQVGRIISYALILLLLVGVVGFIAYFTNGFTEDFKSFYVNVNGENVLDEENGVIVCPEDPLDVKVRYTFGVFSKKLTGYEIEIVPAADFVFYVDGAAHSFANEQDLTGGFDIVGDDESFTITPKGGLVYMLSGVYPDCVIEVDRETVPKDVDLFTVIVYSRKRSASIPIGCRFKDPFTEGVTLNKEAIEF